MFIVWTYYGGGEGWSANPCKTWGEAVESWVEQMGLGNSTVIITELIQPRISDASTNDVMRSYNLVPKKFGEIGE